MWIDEVFWFNFKNIGIVVFFIVVIFLIFGMLGGYVLVWFGFCYVFWILMVVFVFCVMLYIMFVLGYLLWFFEWNVWGILLMMIIVFVVIN